MSKKIKKYFLLIPTLIVMLFNCVCYGQVVFSASAIDYNSFFHPFSDCGLEEYCNITDSDAVMSKVHSRTGTYNYYIYTLSASESEYNKFLNGEEYTLDFSCVLFDDLSNIIHTDSFFYLKKGVQKIYECVFNSDFSGINDLWYNAGVDDHYEMGFSYCKLNGVFRSFWAFDSSKIDANYHASRHYFYQASNIPDFPFFYDFDAAGSVLDVDVDISPELTEYYQFTYEAASISPGITLTITNNSSRPIQYTFDIHSADYTLFEYYTDEWVYSEVNSNPTYVNKPTKFHYVAAKSSDTVFFSYQHINFDVNVLYYIKVKYGFSLDDCATELFTNGTINDFNYYPDSPFAVEMLDNYFIHDFSFIDFPFLYKRPSEYDSPYLPYDSEIDANRYNSSYNAYEREDGSIDYNGKAPDEFYVWEDNEAIKPGVIGGFSSGSSSDGSFKSFASSFNGFFNFILYMFNYCPTGIKNLFILGFSALVIIAFIKKVF